MNGLNRYLDFESKEELYTYKLYYKNTLLYPIVRFYLLQSAIEEIQGIPSPYEQFKVKKIAKIKYFLTSFLCRPQKAKQSDIVFFGTDISNILLNGAYFNRLTETFANEYPNTTILIERSDKLKYKKPRSYSKVYARDYLDVQTSIKVRTHQVSNSDLKQIDSFLNFLKTNFPCDFAKDSVWENVRIKLIHFAKGLPYAFDTYVKLLKRLSPKILFVEEACYGMSNLPLLLAAKELSIPIGEYQHGLISLIHPAYNYSKNLHKSYLQYLPDFFLCYGEYWKQNSRLPIHTVNIGNPYLSDAASQYTSKIEKTNTILYVSSALEPERYVEEVLQLHNRLHQENYDIIFRIHPSEENRIEHVYKPIVDAGIIIDRAPLYSTLEQVKFVIGDISTVLFEAVQFACIIFVQNLPYNNLNVDTTKFNIFVSIDDLVTKLKTGNYNFTSSQDIWENSWRLKYRQFIESHI